MKIVYIYTLLDPRDNLVHYVGKCINPIIRLRSHLKPSNLIRNTKKDQWIKSLLSLNLKPIISIIEKTTVKSWQRRERFWIKFYKEQGLNLVNTTSGGAGVKDGAYFSPEARLKISLTHKGNTYSIGRKLSIDTRKKLVSH
jgi:hypothetical protein